MFKLLSRFATTQTIRTIGPAENKHILRLCHDNVATAIKRKKLKSSNTQVIFIRSIGREEDLFVNLHCRHNILLI